jgi:hypothetical protein
VVIVERLSMSGINCARFLLCCTIRNVPNASFFALIFIFIRIKTLARRRSVLVGLKLRTKMSDSKRVAKDLLAGTVAGVAQVLSGQPFDTIKVRLQTMPVPAPGEAPMYSGTLDAIKKTVGREGWSALYKGERVTGVVDEKRNALTSYRYWSLRLDSVCWKRSDEAFFPGLFRVKLSG